MVLAILNILGILVSWAKDAGSSELFSNKWKGNTPIASKKNHDFK